MYLYNFNNDYLEAFGSIKEAVRVIIINHASNIYDSYCPEALMFYPVWFLHPFTAAA